MQTPPPQVPAKMVLPLVANEKIDILDKPLLAGIQLAPLFVDKNTPPPSIPTKRLVPLDTIARTYPPVGPLVGSHCEAEV